MKTVQTSGFFDDGQVRGLLKEEVDAVRAEGGGKVRVDEAKELFEQVALGENFVEFLTLPAYEVLEPFSNSQR